MKILPINTFNNRNLIGFGKQKAQNTLFIKDIPQDTVSFSYDKKNSTEPYKCGMMSGYPMDKMYATKAVMHEINKKTEDTVQRANSALENASELKEEVKKAVDKKTMQAIVKENNDNTLVVIPKDDKTIVASLNKDKAVNLVNVFNANSINNSASSKETYVYDADGSLKQYASFEYTQGNRKTKINYGINALDEEKKEGTKQCSKKEVNHIEFDDDKKVQSAKFFEQIFNNGNITYKRTISRTPDAVNGKMGYEICEDVSVKDEYGKEERVHKGFIKYDY